MAIHAGSWFGLPDYGITEKIGSMIGAPRTAQGGSNLLGGQKAASPTVLGQQQMYPSQSFGQISAYKPPVVQKVNNTPTTQNTDTGFQFPQLNITAPNESMGGGPSEMDVINNEFNQFNSYLDQQEGQAQSNFTETQGLYDVQKANAEKQYGQEKTTQMGEIKSTEALDLKKVRQILQDLQQGNAARTAISGGGSISEVLGERFGREAQSRLGGVMDVSQKAIQRVGDFYNNAITKLGETYNANILQARQSLNDNLSNIRLARNQSATAKQQGQLTAWRDYYSQINNAKTQAATFKAQYDLWKQQQDAQLAATSGFNQANASAFNTGMDPYLSNTPQAPGIQQTQDQYNMNPTWRIPTTKTPDEYQKYLESLGLTTNSIGSNPAG